MGGSSKSGGISKEGNPFQLLPGAKGIFNNWKYIENLIKN
jgi:hypothetical protein